MGRHSIYIWIEDGASLPIYVGQTKNFKQREHDHRRKTTQVIGRWVNKHQSASMVEVVVGLDQDAADRVEIELISLFRLIGGCRLNIADGGNCQPPPESLKRGSDSSMSVISEDLVAMMRREFRDNPESGAVWRYWQPLTGLYLSTIRGAMSGKKWKHVDEPPVTFRPVSGSANWKRNVFRSRIDPLLAVTMIESDWSTEEVSDYFGATWTHIGEKIRSIEPSFDLRRIKTARRSSLATLR